MKYNKTSLRAIVMALFVSSAVLGYDFRPGDFFLRPSVGTKINSVRGSSSTPGAGLLLGMGADYIIDFNWGVSGDIRLNFSPDFFEPSLMPGIKYWLSQVPVPFIPFCGIYLPIAILVPTKNNSLQTNIGLRPVIGVEYFVMRNFAVGLESGFVPSMMMSSNGVKFEFSVDASFFISWRS